jgi:hypothetical protein
MPRGNAARQDHENYTQSLMPYRRACDKRAKLDVAIANVVGPLA